MARTRNDMIKGMESQRYSLARIGSAPNLKVGETHANVEDVKGYLKRYGYLSLDENHPTTITDPTSEALFKLQKQFALPATGVLDAPSRQVMSRSRCGMPDLSPIAANTQGPFDHRDLKFAFGNASTRINDGVARDCIRRAFQTWAAANVGLTFDEVAPTSAPDILIEWRPANDPDHSMIGGVLAHADFPPGFSIIVALLPLPLHFDDEEHDWVDGAAINAYDIETVALHEIGHCLGLAHSSVPGSVMFPTVATNFTLRDLQTDDIIGINSLYPEGIGG